MINSSYLVKASLVAAADALTLLVEGMGGIAVQLAGTFVATVQFEGSVDGVNFKAVLATPVGSTTQVSSATATGIWTANVVGMQYFRVRCSAYTSGTASATLRSVIAAPGGAGGGGGGGGGDASAANQVLEIADLDLLVPQVGATNEAAAATDTSTSGLNGLLKRIAQRVTSLIALFPAALGAGGGLKVDGSGTALPVSGTVAVTGIATSAKQDLQTADLDLIAASASVLDDWDESDRAKVNLIAGQAGILGGTGVDAANVPRVSLVTNVGLPAGSALLGKVGIDQTTPGTTNAVSLPAIAAVATVTSVNDSASSQTLLSSNAARKGYKLFNDTTVVAYVKEGTTATTSDYSYQLQPGGYYEFGGVGTYTGRIDCIWASDASGAMKVTEVV